jgi:hypothetical protein
MRLLRYRCLRPILLYGRILSTGEVIRLPPADAAEHVETGHLRELETINGEAKRWTTPTVRKEVTS